MHGYFWSCKLAFVTFILHALTSSVTRRGRDLPVTIHGIASIQLLL